MGNGLVAAAHVGEELGEADVGGGVVGVSGEGGLGVFEFGAETVLGDQAEGLAGGGVIGSAAEGFLVVGRWPRRPGRWPATRRRNRCG